MISRSNPAGPPNGMRQMLRVGTPMRFLITRNMPTSDANTVARMVATPRRRSRANATQTPSGSTTSSTSSFTSSARTMNTQYSRHLRSSAP